jgi:hypothetical protein
VAAATYFGFPAPASDGPDVLSRTFTRTEASRELQQRTAALSHCVASVPPGATSGQPVDIALEVYVEPDGRLTRAMVPDVNGLGSTFATCVKEEVEHWRLSQGAVVPVVVAVPWRFRRP